MAVETIDESAAAAGHQDPHHHADRRGLAGTVGSQESEHLAAADPERQGMHGGEVAIGTRELLEFDHAPQCMLPRRRGSMDNKNEMAPWQHADLPSPPRPRGLSWIGVCGPGVIVLGV